MHVGLAWECKPGRGLLAHPRPVFRRPDRLQEWVVALSLAPAWLFNVDEWRPGLVQLWRQHMPAAAAVDWWMQQTAAPGGSEGRCSLSRQQQRLSAICSTDYLSLIGELLGPVAGKVAVQHAQQVDMDAPVSVAQVDTTPVAASWCGSFVCGRHSHALPGCCRQLLRHTFPVHACRSCPAHVRCHRGSRPSFQPRRGARFGNPTPPDPQHHRQGSRAAPQSNQRSDSSAFNASC